MKQHEPSQESTQRPETTRRNEPQPVAAAHAESHTSSGEAEGPSGRSPEGVDQERHERGDAPTDEHRLRGGHRPRVPGLEDLNALEQSVEGAFRDGNPAKAWDATQQLVAFCREALTDGAKARFKANFGTSMCDNCEGLKAGPDVVATCFQRQLCYFANFKATTTSPKHLRVIDSLLGDEKIG